MEKRKKIKELVEKQIDFSAVEIGFKVELSEKNERYIVIEKKQGYQLEKKSKKGSFKLSLSCLEELEKQKKLAKDKSFFCKLFKKLNKGEIDKVSISGLKLRNPILTASIGQSVIANLSKLISPEERKELYLSWQAKNKEEFQEKLYDLIVDKMITTLQEKLNSNDLPTPVFPTSVALTETPNYYICEPKEEYALDTKLELFRKLTDSICGRCGDRLYGLYVPEEGYEIKEILKSYVPDFYNVNIVSMAGAGRINSREIEPFEYAFYLLDKVFQEMFRENKLPDYHIELLVIEGVGGRKKFYSHYIIPNLNEIYHRLYYGDEKYIPERGISKIKAMISSFLVENWEIERSLKDANSQIAHFYINRILYHVFCHKRLDIDSILSLEDLKIKLGDSTPILFLEEVMSWM